MAHCASSYPLTSAIVGCPTVGTIATTRPAADAAQTIEVSNGPQGRQREVWSTAPPPEANATLHDHMAPCRGCVSRSCDAEAARCGGARGEKGALGV